MPGHRHPRASFTSTHSWCRAGCPDNTEWFLVTNGDNEYATTLFSHLEQARDADIVAFDFYSRYQRVTGECGTA